MSSIDGFELTINTPRYAEQNSEGRSSPGSSLDREFQGNPQQAIRTTVNSPTLSQIIAEAQSLALHPPSLIEKAVIIELPYLKAGLHDAQITVSEGSSAEKLSNFKVAAQTMNWLYGHDTGPENKPVSPHRKDLNDDRHQSLTKIQNQTNALTSNLTKDFEAMALQMDESEQARYQDRIYYSVRAFAGASVLEQLKTAQDGVLVGANCGELADAAFVIVARSENNVCVETMMLKRDGPAEGPDHLINVIGRDQGTDSSDYRTWNEAAVVLDVHSRRIYPASDFQTEMENIPEFSKGQTETKCLARHPANTAFPIADGDAVIPGRLLDLPWMQNHSDANASVE